ncbi:hypothetical protein C8F01DRAFT_1084911 [Mycena amicta]|nr:hypothetical protein C8F01DRAFT_1084911 [Mycena amicta]
MMTKFFALVPLFVALVGASPLTVRRFTPTAVVAVAAAGVTAAPNVADVDAFVKTFTGSPAQTFTDSLGIVRVGSPPGPLPAVPCTPIPFLPAGDPDEALPQCRNVPLGGIGIECTNNPNAVESLQPQVITSDLVKQFPPDANTIVVSPDIFDGFGAAGRR